MWPPSVRANRRCLLLDARFLLLGVCFRRLFRQSRSSLARVDRTALDFLRLFACWIWRAKRARLNECFFVFFYRNAVLHQFMKQKLLRKAIHARVRTPTTEPIGEDEKKRIVLGNVSGKKLALNSTLAYVRFSAGAAVCFDEKEIKKVAIGAWIATCKRSFMMCKVSTVYKLISSSGAILTVCMWKATEKTKFFSVII